ncbi:MAG: hypothetical protein U0527_13815 [Candidatus Eisenbacteria bacterium]
MIPNGAELPPLDHAASLAARRALGIPDLKLPRGGSAGASTGGRGSPFLDGVDRLAHPDLTFRLRTRRTGGPLSAGRAAPTARKRHSLGAQPEARLLHLLHAAQLIVAPYRPDFLERNGGEGLKVLQGLAVDRPVLTSRGATPPVPEPALSIVEHFSVAWASAFRRWVESVAGGGAPSP